MVRYAIVVWTLLHLLPFSLKATKKQLNAAAKARQERLMARQAKRNMAAKDTQRLNKTRYEAPDADVALTSELRGSLRLATVSWLSHQITEIVDK